jgi:acetate CoA/acetoacetate CoA-transferase beta subunit
VTGFGEVDLVITELGVFAFEARRLVLKEIAPEVSLEALAALTEARFEVSRWLQPMVLS